VLLPLRCCLLSGGESRRMGQDKALLSHPEGGSWLKHSLELLAQLGEPITLFTRHPQHLTLADSLGLAELQGWAEPPPHEGPLLALARLMQQYPDQRLLLCPIDMPKLTMPVLQSLLAAAAQEPDAIHVAQDGRRCQPLLGVYPSTPDLRQCLTEQVNAGERRLQCWLENQSWRAVVLDPQALRNVNRPQELSAPAPEPA
jgi:molybdopterin-guanine dinucleotide biosynthesis protein A